MLCIGSIAAPVVAAISLHDAFATEEIISILLALLFRRNPNKKISAKRTNVSKNARYLSATLPTPIYIDRGKFDTWATRERV